MKPIIFTVGHSSHTAEHFLQLLKQHSISCLVDVRSVPASKYNPQYNQTPLSNILRHENIAYLHLPREFGARHTDPDLLDKDGKVDFEKVRKTWNFKNGIERLRQGLAKGYTIALMCSESEPLDCHRFSMISAALEEEELDVRHILKDGRIKTNQELEDDLLKKYEKKLPAPDMFQPRISREEKLKVAFRLCNKDIAYMPTEREKEKSPW